MRRSGDATKYPGVKRVGERLFRVRGKVMDPRTGRRKEIDRVVEAASVHEAARARAELLWLEERRVEPARRLRVGEYAQSWMRSKALKLDGATARTYADALEQHVLPALGELFYDQVTTRDVQAWLDDAILNGWKTKRGVKKRYSPKSVHGVVPRVPDDDSGRDARSGWSAIPRCGCAFRRRTRSSSATASAGGAGRVPRGDEGRRHPQHYGLVAAARVHGTSVLSRERAPLGGLGRGDQRASGGPQGRPRRRRRPVSRKKQAPKEYPVEPELAAALDEHRASC